MTQPDRASIPPNIETNILVKSGRRCALCFGLEGDGRIKPGQIAHLDKKRENNKENNLAFLCLFHHDQYDGKTSQSKGFTQSETKRYREKLYQAIESGFLPKNSDQDLENKSSEIIEHDKSIFYNGDSLLSEQTLNSMLYELRNDHSYQWLQLIQVIKFIEYVDKVENHFICENLNDLREAFVKSIDVLNEFLSLKFYIYPENQTGENIRYCLQPDLNIDRGGYPSEYTFTEYGKLTEVLENHCLYVGGKYKEYRLQVKRMLTI
jgi:hypothetical protein